MSELTTTNPIPKDDDIDMFEIACKLWAGRKTILLATVLFVAIGGLHILYKKLTVIPEYESSVTINVDAPSPDLIPTLITGAPFMTEVLNIRLVYPHTGKLVTVMEVLNKHTYPPQGNLAGLMGRVSTRPGKPGALIVSVVMQDPLIAMQMVDSVIQKLVPFMETYQSPRMKNNLQYLESRCRYAESDYLKSLKILSDFYDQHARNNQTLDTITVKRLKAESELKFDIYSGLVKQLETSRLKEHDQIPICNILEPATIANQNNEPKIAKPLLLMMFLGLIAGVVLLFGKSFYNKIKMNSV